MSDYQKYKCLPNGVASRRVYVKAFHLGEVINKFKALNIECDFMVVNLANGTTFTFTDLEED